MVNFYVNMIKNGSMTIDQVPSRWREQVKEVMANA